MLSSFKLSIFDGFMSEAIQFFNSLKVGEEIVTLIMRKQSLKFKL